MLTTGAATTSPRRRALDLTALSRASVGGVVAAVERLDTSSPVAFRQDTVALHIDDSRPPSEFATVYRIRFAPGRRP